MQGHGAGGFCALCCVFAAREGSAGLFGPACLLLRGEGRGASAGPGALPQWPGGARSRKPPGLSEAKEMAPVVHSLPLDRRYHQLKKRHWILENSARGALGAPSPASQETGPRDRKKKSLSSITQPFACPCPHGHGPASSCLEQPEVKLKVFPKCCRVVALCRGGFLSLPFPTFL